MQARYRTVTTLRVMAAMLRGRARMNLEKFATQDGRRVSDKERAFLLLPRPSLSGCIALAIVRDTRGVTMNDAQRLSHFPRSPYCGLSWIHEGEVFELKRDPGGEASEWWERLPDVCVSGPRPQPTTMWSPGVAHGVTVVFYPDAWQALTGIGLNAIREKNLPSREVFKQDIADIVGEAAAQPDAKTGFELLEDRLEPFWRERRPKGQLAPFWFMDWTTALAMRAATSGMGRSLRQAQRRVKTWAGLSQRDLDQQARVEKLFAESLKQGTSDLAGLAEEFGYADQAHMGRQVRRITGAPPAKIMDLIETEESYWIYRLMGERFQAAK
jgi:hypothetical protein